MNVEEVNKDPKVLNLISSLFKANEQLFDFGISIRARYENGVLTILSRDWAFSGSELVRLVFVRKDDCFLTLKSSECISAESFGFNVKPEDEDLSFCQIKNLIANFVTGWIECQEIL